MYDPTIGRFLKEDPLGFSGGDFNLSRYVGNDPLNATDPTGLFRIKNGGPFRSQPYKEQIHPIAGKIASYGRDVEFYWDPGDAMAVVQKVSAIGHLTITDDTGFEHTVFWEEEYTEAWGRPGARANDHEDPNGYYVQDRHKSGPRLPMAYLESKAGFKLKADAKQNKLTMTFISGECREVDEWDFHMTTKFEVIAGLFNVGGQLFPVSGGFFQNPAAPLKVISLSTNGSTMFNVENKSFDSMLSGTGVQHAAIKFPPDQKRGTSQIATDTWTGSWKSGQPNSEIVYSSTGYR